MADSERPTAHSPSFEIPDLELEPVRPMVRRPDPRPSTSLAHEPMPQLGRILESFDVDPFEHELPSLDLDDGSRTPGEPSSNGRAAPIDAAAVLALAGYGEPPHAVQLTPGYALRVFLRQRVLKRQLRAQSAELARAEVEREAALGELAHQLFATVQSMPAFSKQVSAITELAGPGAHDGRAPRERRALAELGQAILAARTGVEIPAHWLPRVQELSERVERSRAQCELLARATLAYDVARVRQGVRLAFTLVILLIVLLSLKFTV